jgi:hypothetical protein
MNEHDEIADYVQHHDFSAEMDQGTGDAGNPRLSIQDWPIRQA